MKTTIKVRLRASKSMPGSGTPVIQITRHRLTTTSTSYCVVSSEEWDEEKGEVIIPEKTPAKRKKELLALSQKLQEDVQMFQETAEMLKAQGDYSAKELVRYVKKRKQGQMFCDYADTKIEELLATSRHGVANLYKYATRSFLSFLENNDICFDQIKVGLIKRYEQYLFDNKKSKHTVASYIRSLKTIYNCAIEEKIFFPKNPNWNPFFDIFADNNRTAKRAIDVESISQQPAKLDPDEPKPDENLFRDIFLLSFYAH